MQTLTQDNTFIYMCFSEDHAGIFRTSSNVSTLISRITKEDVAALVENGMAVEYTRSARGVRYRAPNRKNKSIGRTAAERRKARFLEAERFFQETPDQPARIVKVTLAESPLGWLSRRRDSKGAPFLEPELVDAGERLRADFERAQLGPSVTQDWRRFLVPAGQGSGKSAQERAASGSAEEARGRIMHALATLGPGLSDAALRTCCFLEGLEAVEQRMDWSARSGKIVLKIALQRLAEHYDETDRDEKHGEIPTFEPS